MDFSNIPFLLLLTISSLVAFFIFAIFFIRRKSRLDPDYNHAISVIEVAKVLEKLCPLGTTTNWKLILLDHGSQRCWTQTVFPPFLKNGINLYGSAVSFNSSSVTICSLIADVAKWPEWNPFYSSHFVIKSFQDKQLRRDRFMEAEQVVSIIRGTNNIHSETFMYRFHDFSENKVGWILFWEAKKCEFMFFLVQPITNKNDNPTCLLTHIIGTESKYSSSASVVLQRLRNIKDLLIVSSLNVMPSKISPSQSNPKEAVSQNKNQTSSCSFQENYFSLSSIRARKREIRDTVYTLIPFVSSSPFFWKNHIEFKLAVKNIDSAGSGSTKEEIISNSKTEDLEKKPLKRNVSDVGAKLKSFVNINKDSDASDSGRTFISYLKEPDSKLKDNASESVKQNSDTSEDSESKNNVTSVKDQRRLKLRSFSETNINDMDSCKLAKELNRKRNDDYCKLEDINENIEDNVVAMYEQEDYKEMYNSSISDYEIVEKSEFNENRIAELLTQGNYGASELQAEVLLASHFEHDINSGNFRFAGDWMLHSSYKGMTVLTKTTCSQFMKIVSFLCQTELSVSPQDVWRFVKNPQFRFICDESVKSVEVLEKISTSQKLIHTYHEVSGFLRKELIDFCLLQTEREELNKYYSCFYSVEFDKCPFMNSVIRGTLRPSGWIVEKINDDAKKSKVTYMIQVLVSSPDSLFIQTLSSMVPQSMNNLKNYITSKPM